MSHTLKESKSVVDIQSVTLYRRDRPFGPDGQELVTVETVCVCDEGKERRDFTPTSPVGEPIRSVVLGVYGGTIS